MDTQEPRVPPLPPIATLPSSVDKLLDIHEDRIQGLESVSRDTASILGTHTQRLNELGTKVDSAVVEIGQKLEEVVKPITQAIVRIDNTLSDAAGRVVLLEKDKAEEQRLKRSSEDRTAARRAKVSALIWSVVGAAFTVLVKDGIPALIKLFH